MPALQVLDEPPEPALALEQDEPRGLDELQVQGGFPERDGLVLPERGESQVPDESASWVLGESQVSQVPLV